MSVWSHPFDSQIYCSSSIDMTNLLKFIKNYNLTSKIKIGPTVFILKLVSNLVVKYPKINGHIIFGKFIKKNCIDVSVQVAGDDLRTSEIITIKNGEALSLEEIGQIIQKKKEQFKNGTDVNVGRKMFFMYILPTFLLSPFLRILSNLSVVGLNLSWMGIPKYHTGSAVICNYGKFGLEDTFLPISPFSNSPFCIGISKIKEYVPKNESEEEASRSEKRYKCKFCFTIDHRFLDGSFASKLLDDIKATIENPEIVFDREFFKEIKKTI